MSHRHFGFQLVGQVAVVRFSVQQFRDQSLIDEFGQDLHALLEVDGHKRFVINFSATRLLSSAVTNQIVGLQRKVEKLGGGVRLCHIPDGVMSVYRTQRLVMDGPDSYFKVFDAEGTAIVTPWPDPRV